MSNNIHKNPVTPFTPTSVSPTIDPSACVHPLAAVIGHVILEQNVFVAPAASVRGDEGIPIYIGADSNVQDGVVIHALETFHNGQSIPANLRTVNGQQYAVYIGQRVSLAHQSQIHGPAVVGDDTFVGMQSLVFKSTVGNGCVIEPGAKLINVIVPEGRYVPAGQMITQQSQADALPEITDDYPYGTLNAAVTHVNTCLAEAYREKAIF